MPFDNYQDLQNSVLNQLGRPDDASISGAIPDAIALFESDANKRLRTHWQEELDTITTVGATDTYTLPDDFLAIREVRLSSITPTRVLKFYESAEIDKLFPWGNSNAPIAYTLEASSIRFVPIPDSVYTIGLRYFGKIPGLSDDNPSNWLLVESPELYLYGVCAQMVLYLGADSTDDNFTQYGTLREQGYASLRLADLRFRTGGSPLQMKSYLSRGYQS